MACGFENAASFVWYRNGERLPESGNRTFLVIPVVTLMHRGYYMCEGVGLNGQTARTNSSLLLIEGTKCRQ